MDVLAGRRSEQRECKGPEIPRLIQRTAERPGKLEQRGPQREFKATEGPTSDYAYYKLCKNFAFTLN